MPRLLITIILLTMSTGLLLTACSSGFTEGGSVQAPQVGKEAPDFRLTNLEGQSISLRDFRGQPVFVNFWASWCGPCRAEMPYIQAVFEKWSARGLVILGIDIGESRATVEDFMQELDLSFTVLLDSNQAVAEEYRIRFIPTTFLIDGDGIIQAVKPGAYSSVAEIETSLSKIMP